MASAANLMGLVNQLQNMEQSLSSILIEHCLKLASLTDANVFLLIETAEGRRYAGKRHLCESYSSGTLTPIGNDVELGLETNEPRLVEKNNLNFSWQQQQNSSWQNASMSDASFGGTMNSPGQHQATPPSRKRQSQQQQHRVAAAAIAAANNKKARLSTVASADDTASASPAAETSSSSSSQHQMSAGQRNNLDMQMVVDIKAEQAPYEEDGGTDGDHQPQLFDPHQQGGEVLEDDDDDIQEIPREGDESASQSLLGVGDVFGGSNSANQQQLQAFNPSGGGGGAGASVQLLPDGTDMIVVNLHEFLRENRKQMVLQSHLGPSFTVDSVEFKLLSSMTYEYAKQMTALCPYMTSAEPRAKELFQKSFALYWNHFPAFQQIHDNGMKVLDGKNPVSFKTFVRGQLQRSFINLMRKKT